MKFNKRCERSFLRFIMGGRQVFSSANSPLDPPSLNPRVLAGPTPIQQQTAFCSQPWPCDEADTTATGRRMPATTRSRPLRHLPWTHSSATLPGSGAEPRAPRLGRQLRRPWRTQRKEGTSFQKTALSAAGQRAAQTAPYETS